MAEKNKPDEPQAPEPRPNQELAPMITDQTGGRTPPSPGSPGWPGACSGCTSAGRIHPGSPASSARNRAVQHTAPPARRTDTPGNRSATSDHAPSGK